GQASPRYDWMQLFMLYFRMTHTQNRSNLDTVKQPSCEELNCVSPRYSVDSALTFGHRAVSTDDLALHPAHAPHHHSGGVGTAGRSSGHAGQFGAALTKTACDSRSWSKPGHRDH